MYQNCEPDFLPQHAGFVNKSDRLADQKFHHSMQDLLVIVIVFQWHALTWKMCIHLHLQIQNFDLCHRH